MFIVVENRNDRCERKIPRYGTGAAPNALIQATPAAGIPAATVFFEF